MTTGVSAHSSYGRKYYGIRFLFLMLLHSTSTKGAYGNGEENMYYVEGVVNEDSREINNTTSTERGSWHHVSLDDMGTVIETHLQEVRTRHLSSTVLMKLIPFEDTMNHYQITVYQNGLKNFLVAQFGKDENYDLEIKGVSVVRNDIAMTADRQELFTAEDHVLHVESTVSAELGIEASPLSSEDFNKIVLQYCTEFSDNLIRSWQAEEIDTIDRGDDRFEDYIAFGQVFHVELEIVPQAGGDGVEGAFGRSAHKIISLIAALLAFLLISASFIYRHYKIMKYARSQQGSLYGDCTQDTDSDETGSLASLSLGSSKERTHFPRHKKEYGIVPHGDKINVIKRANILRLPRRKSQKHDYKEVTDTNSPSIPSLTDMDGQSISPCSSTGDRSDDDESVSSIRSNILRGRTVVENECHAPAGKLGVSIDTVGGQPVVHRVKEDSPLHNVLQRLDIIVKIDEINTSSMSAADVTLIMAKRMGKERCITYLRGVEKELQI